MCNSPFSHGLTDHAVSHCICVYYQDWHRAKPPRRGNEGGVLPGVSEIVHPQGDRSVMSDASRRNTLASTTGVVVAVNDEVPRTPVPQTPSPSTGLPFDEEAKLVYGVVLSLRNMIKKLSGK